ncbi:DUF2061 domain-containing protein [Emcibacter sp. SYSU 3D8]|uniref:DUF2061 domain-containing protein n=1 Tax=Emcibacter sp. SYSU 3D8 TaxID=3133969 RepID=UPI0031FE653F
MGTPRLHLHEALPEKRWRSIVKAISWRIIGSLDTLVLSYVVMAYIFPWLGLDAGVAKRDMLNTAGYIALAEIVTKIGLFYLHERAWVHVPWNVTTNARGGKREGMGRSAAKTFSWRVLASADTALLAFLFTGTVGAALTIGGLEVWTKLALFFVHERIWQRIPIGYHAV